MGDIFGDFDFGSFSSSASGTLTSMLDSVATSIPNITTLIIALMFITGLIFIGMALFKMTKLANGNSQTTFFSVMVTFFIGVCLVSSLSTFDLVMTTIGVNSSSSSSVLSYVGNTGNSFNMRDTLEKILIILIPFGWMSFFRGLLTMNAAANRSSQDAGFGKGLVYIIGGVLLAHAGWTVCLVANTFGTGVCQ